MTVRVRSRLVYECQRWEPNAASTYEEDWDHVKLIIEENGEIVICKEMHHII